MPLRARESPTFRQLTVIVREQINAHPTDCYADLKDAIKRRLIALGFATPWPHELATALDAVEVARHRPMARARPAHADPSTSTLSASDANSPSPPDGRPLDRDEASALLAQIETRLGPVPIKTVAAARILSPRAADRRKAVANEVGAGGVTCQPRHFPRLVEIQK